MICTVESNLLQVKINKNINDIKITSDINKKNGDYFHKINDEKVRPVGV